MTVRIEILEILATGTRFRVFDFVDLRATLGFQSDEKVTRRKLRQALQKWLQEKFKQDHGNRQVYSHWDLYDFSVWKDDQCLSEWDGDKHLDIDEDYKETGEDWFQFHAMNFFAKRKPRNPATVLRQKTVVETV